MVKLATSTRKRADVPLKWRKLFALLPGYDPIATAGDCWFDVDAAERAVAFIRDCCTHVKGHLAGKPMDLVPHEVAITGCIMGWKRPDGYRRFREVLYFVPRKNSKSTWAAAMALLILFTDDEAGAECYTTAADRDQAALIFNIAKSMVFNESELDSRATVYETSKTIKYGNSALRSISAEANTKHGYNTHLAINDEIHAHKSSELLDVIETSTGARKQPLIIHITTSDFDREGSVCNQKHEYATKVRDGIIDDPTFLPVIYEASIEDDWTSPEVWRKANPMLGLSVSEDYLARMCRKAQEEPTFENTFKRLHLNIRTQQDVRWLQMARWDECGGDVVRGDLAGRPCYAGLDLSTTTDISALLLYFPDEHQLLPMFWIPENNAHAREKRDRVPYLTWARKGLIEMTEGDVIDYDVIHAAIRDIGDEFDIQEIAIDRWNSTQLQTQLSGDGFEVVQFGQGYASMSAPTKELERLVLDGDLAHGGNPVLRWMASNVSVEMDAAGNVKPSKKKSTEKIDGIVAAIMAIGRAMVCESPQMPGVYAL